MLTWNPARKRLYLHLLVYPYRRLPVAFADRIAYAQFLHDRSEIGLKSGELELPPEKLNVEIPVVEIQGLQMTNSSQR